MSPGPDETPKSDLDRILHDPKATQQQVADVLWTDQDFREMVGVADRFENSSEASPDTAGKDQASQD